MESGWMSQRPFPIFRFLLFCVCFCVFFLKTFFLDAFFFGGDVDRILLGLDCVFGVWG